MNKPTNPNVVVPAQFATNGVKIGFTQEKIESGFSNSAADVLAGDNLNQFIDDVYKSITYSNAGVADLYKSAVIYDGAETYRANDIVFNVNNGSVTLYRSLANNNTGNPLTDNTKWSQVQLGADILNLVQPIGSPVFMAKNAFPDGLDAANSSYIWLNGAAVSRTTYASLFDVYGTTYGIGDGSTTFNLPNASSRYIYCDTSFGYISAGIPNLGLSTQSNGSHSHGKGTLRVRGSIKSTDTREAIIYADTLATTGVFEVGDTKTNFPAFSTSGTGTVRQGIYLDTDYNNGNGFTGSTASAGSHTHTINASNSLYGASNSLQVAGLKFKVCTRWR